MPFELYTGSIEDYYYYYYYFITIILLLLFYYYYFITIILLLLLYSASTLCVFSFLCLLLDIGIGSTFPQEILGTLSENCHFQKLF